MEIIDYLSWSAVTNPSNSWIELEYPPGNKSKESVTGTGSQDVTITVTPSTVVGDTDTAGTVTFICSECNPPMREVVVNVTRCFPTECTEWTYTYEPVEVDCNAHSSVNVNYTGTCVTDPSYTKTGVSSYTINIECYDGDTDYIIQETPFKITQKPGDCVCHECDCDNITVDYSELTWEYNDTGHRNVEITVSDSCKNLINITTAATTGDFEVTLEGSTLEISPTGENPGTGGDKTGSVSITYTIKGAEYTCSGKVSLTQKSQGCSCTDLKISDTSVNINAGATTSVTYTANCVTIVSITTNDDNISIDTGTTGVINITGNTNGSATITIKSSIDGDNCEDRTITVDVGCPTITINVTKDDQPFEGDIPCEGATITFTKTIS